MSWTLANSRETIETTQNEAASGSYEYGKQVSKYLDRSTQPAWLPACTKEPSPKNQRPGSEGRKACVKLKK